MHNREIRVESRFHYFSARTGYEQVMGHNNGSKIVNRVSQFPIKVDFGAFSGNWKWPVSTKLSIIKVLVHVFNFCLLSSTLHHIYVGQSRT